MSMHMHISLQSRFSDDSSSLIPPLLDLLIFLWSRSIVPRCEEPFLKSSQRPDPDRDRDRDRARSLIAPPSLHLVPAGVATYTLSFQDRRGGLGERFRDFQCLAVAPSPREGHKRPWQDCTHG